MNGFKSFKTQSAHFLPETGWFTREKAGSGLDRNDVQIVITKGNNETRRNLTIRFYDSCAELISDTGYAQIQIYKNRMFFRSAEKDKGYMLSGHKNGDSKTKRLQISITAEMAKDLSYAIGDYDLRYDDFYEYYYVELRGAGNE